MLKTIESSIKNIMLIFSFLVSLTLVIVVVVLCSIIFQLKSGLATPLIDGLHSSFVGLDQSTIDWTIPVRDTIPIKLNIPLQTDTIVTLTQGVPLAVNATINLPGVGVLNNARVNLELPAGLQLPVHLDLNVPVDQPLPISMDVRAVIPIEKTQLHDPLLNLQLLFEPLVRVLRNLPDNYGEVGPLVTAVLNGRGPDLMAAGQDAPRPWPGYSQTAGLGYTLSTEPIPQANQPLQTGIVPPGGIPDLDKQLRPEVYQAGGPAVVNATRDQALQGEGVPAFYYNGTFGDHTEESVDLPPPTDQPVLTSGGGSGAGAVNTGQPTGGGGVPVEATALPTQEGDLGILPSSTGG